MLFETAESAAAGESAASGDQSQAIQINFTGFLANLFHFKPGSRAYSIDPEMFGKVPLFIKNKEDTTVLNDFFFLRLLPRPQLAILDDVQPKGGRS